MKKNESVNKPMFVFRDGMLADSSYVEWLSDVKKRFRQSRVKASIRVNTEMLEFYWGIGRDFRKKPTGRWPIRNAQGFW